MPGGIGPKRQNKNFGTNSKRRMKALLELISECDKKIINSDRELESIKESIVKQNQLIANAEEERLKLHRSFGAVRNDKELSLTRENRVHYKQEFDELLDEYEKNCNESTPNEPVTYVIYKKFHLNELLIYKSRILKIINTSFGLYRSILCDCLEGPDKGLRLSISISDPGIDIYGRFSIDDVVVFSGMVARVVDKFLIYPIRILYTIEIQHDNSIRRVFDMDLPNNF